MAWAPDYGGKMAHFLSPSEEKNCISFKVIRTENTLLVEVQYLVGLIPGTFSYH